MISMRYSHPQGQALQAEGAILGQQPGQGIRADAQQVTKTQRTGVQGVLKQQVQQRRPFRKGCGDNTGSEEQEVRPESQCKQASRNP